MPVLTQPPLVGERIPTVALASPDGQPSDLHAELNGRGGIIYFMRTATCPVCNAHVKNLARLSANNQLYGYEPIIVVPGDRRAANIVATRHGTAHVSVWASEDAHETFGLHVKMGLIQQSGTWVVNPSNEVLHTTTSTIPIQGLNHEAVRETAAVLAGRSTAAPKPEPTTQAAPAASTAPAPAPTHDSPPRHAAESDVADTSVETPASRAAVARPRPDAHASMATVTSLSDRSDATLGRIIDVPLKAVSFTSDYVQLVFGSTTVSCFDWPAVVTPNGTFDVGDPGYRDALCSYLDKPATGAVVDSTDGLRIAVGDALVSIAAAPEPTRAIAAMVVDLSEGVNASWSAGAPSFAATR